MREGFRRMQSGNFLIFEGQIFQQVREHLKLNESEIDHHRVYYLREKGIRTIKK